MPSSSGSARDGLRDLPAARLTGPRFLDAPHQSGCRAARRRHTPSSCGACSLPSFVALWLIRVIAKAWPTTRRMAEHADVCLIGCRPMGGDGVRHHIQCPTLRTYLHMRGVPVPLWMQSGPMEVALLRCLASDAIGRLLNVLAVHTPCTGTYCAP